ncbi:Mycolipanoate synthase [Aspergillus melleus]|uniref:Mycolipanoate synthase n=1 Tax=Aspergillus melleus TaxID=138277 RepID=UPI001E8D81CB|nr:Mycolipanoate synthase [Aspergillus melleus]KAH8422377.1 Mycolipanoate synthase [Aspergillus melleus]
MDHRGISQAKLIELQDPSFPINDPEYAQTLCTALQVGIVNVLSSWQIKPDTVLGHSSGEIAAAYAVGAISSSDAIKIAYYRGFSSKAYLHNGTMAAVSISKETAGKYLNSSVVVACHNAPKSITLSGDADELRLVLDRIAKDFPDTRSKVLNIPIAYHSRKSFFGCLRNWC